MDGTLLDIAHHPDAVAPRASLPGILTRLEDRLGGALALVSGRAIDDLDTIFAPLRLPIAGLHGLQRRDAQGLLHHAETAGVVDDIRGPLRQFADCHEGVLLEDKGSALALHYRQAPAIETDARKMVLALIADRDDLHCLEGKMVFEIKSQAVDKGIAVACFLEEPPFAGRMPVFIGDDVTDEDGFRLVNARGGVSIRVGDPSESVAQYAITDVASVIAWLQDLADSLDSSRSTP